jgi:hypothetical protein
MDKSTEDGSINKFKLLLFSIVFISVVFILLSHFVTLLFVPNHYIALAIPRQPPNQTTTNTTSLDETGPSFLKVIVRVDNTGGGTAKPSDFTITMDLATNALPFSFDGSEKGTIVSMNAQGTYELSVDQKESVTISYGKSFSGDCTGGMYTINPGDKKTCVVTMIYPGF